jgi:flagellin-like hook-associated protein FlgL
MSRLESRREGMSRAVSDLHTAEGALANVSDLLVRARELAIQFADGVYSQSERDAGAKEVAALRQQLAVLANTKGQRGYLFSGTRTQTPAVDALGNFLGDDLPLNIEYVDNQVTPTNVNGRQAFTDNGGTGVDPFAVLEQLRVDLEAGNLAGVRSSLGGLESAHSQVIRVRSDAGLRINRLESAVEVTNNALTFATRQQNDDKQGDFTDIATKLSMAQTAYERSIAVTRQVLNVASAIERF